MLALYCVSESVRMTLWQIHYLPGCHGIRGVGMHVTIWQGQGSDIGQKDHALEYGNNEEEQYRKGAVTVQSFSLQFHAGPLA